MKEYDLYFDFDKRANGIVVAAGLYKKGTYNLLFKETKFIPMRKFNQYVSVLYAMDLAMDLLMKNNVEGIVIINHQNTVLLNWLEGEECNPNYEDLFSIVLEKLKRLSINIEFYINEIEAKYNKAKKIAEKTVIDNKSNIESTEQFRRININLDKTNEDTGSEDGVVIKFQPLRRSAK